MSSAVPFYKNPKIIILVLFLLALAGLFIWKMTKESKPSSTSTIDQQNMTQKMIQSMTEDDQSWNPEKDISKLDDSELSELLKREVKKVSSKYNLSKEQSDSMSEVSNKLDDFGKGKRKSERNEFLILFLLLRLKSIYEDLKLILSKANLSLSKCADAAGVGNASVDDAPSSSTPVAHTYGATSAQSDERSSTQAAGQSLAQSSSTQQDPVYIVLLKSMGNLIECSMLNLVNNEDAFTSCSILALRLIQLSEGSSIRSMLEFKDNKIILKEKGKSNWIKINNSVDQAERISDLEQKLNKPLSVQEFSSILFNIGKIANKKSGLKDCRLCTIPDLE